MNRRTYLASTGVVGLLTPLTGCVGGDEETTPLATATATSNRADNNSESTFAFETLTFRHEHVPENTALALLPSRSAADEFQMPDHARDDYESFIKKTDFEAEGLAVLQQFFPSTGYELHVDEVNEAEAPDDDDLLVFEGTRTGEYDVARDIYETVVIRVATALSQYDSGEAHLNVESPRKGEPERILLRHPYHPDYTEVDVTIGNRDDTTHTARVEIERDGAQLADESVTVAPSHDTSAVHLDEGGTYDLTVMIEDVGTVEETAKLPTSEPVYLPAFYQFTVREDEDIDVRVWSVE